MQRHLFGGYSGVRWLLSRTRGDATPLHLVYDILQTFYGSGEPVDAGDRQHVAGLHEVEQQLQLGPAVAAAAAALLGANYAAADRLGGGTLDAEVLVEGADPSIAVGGKIGAIRSVWI